MTTRRDFLKTAALAPAILGAAADTPPNVVFVICDQMRADALGALGGRNGRTPNLDRLASQGVVFENSFSNNPVCVPSRKSMWTSLYPHQHGSLTNRDGDFLELQNTALGYFKERGYRIGYAGKNHAFTKKAIGSIDMSSIRDRAPFREYNASVPPCMAPSEFTSRYTPREMRLPEIIAPRNAICDSRQTCSRTSLSSRLKSHVT